MAIIVAIDGPAGAGKSTVAKRLAHRLGFVHVDTGAIYRSVTLASQRHGWTDEPSLVAELPTLDLKFEGEQVWLGGEDVTGDIRTPEVTADVSRIAAMPGVRRALLDLQRRLGHGCETGAVLEGRDIGTVVFPEADVKVFLTATSEERARRRLRELVSKGETASFDEVLASIQKRDARDSQRATAPLKQAEDAVRVETDGKTQDDVLEELVALVQRRAVAQP